MYEISISANGVTTRPQKVIRAGGEGYVGHYYIVAETRVRLAQMLPYAKRAVELGLTELFGVKVHFCTK